MEPSQSLLSKWIEKILVINFFLVIAGAAFFLTAVICSANGIELPYRVFQRLWYPLFIPVISLFFTAVLTEALLSRLNQKNS